MIKTVMQSDKQNPDENLRSKRLGLKIMQDFIFKGNNVWEMEEFINLRMAKHMEELLL